MEAVTKIGFPDPLAPFAVKLSKEYGLSIARLISSDWLDPDGRISGNCNLLQRSSYVRKKKLFVRGEYDVSHFKNAYAPREGALELVNLRFKPINFAEKYCRIVSNGMSDKNYQIDIRSTDRLTALNRQAERDRMLKYMVGKPLIQKMKALGVNVAGNVDIPEDEQEIEVKLETKGKPKIEIAEEILINYVLNTNKWDFLSEQYNKDITDIGIQIARVYLDKHDGVKFAYVDPENYFHSRVSTNDFSDKRYEGVVDTISINDIKRESGLADEDLRKIAKGYWPKSKQWDDHCPIDDILGIMVPVMRFAYKTDKTITYKKKTRKGETVKMSRRGDDYQGPEHAKVSNTFDTWLEGNYIVGTDYLYDYKECENLYDDVMNKALSPFVTIAYDIYENRLRSFSDNIEEPVAMLQQMHLKVQQLINELKPDGIAIDISLLAELDDGSAGPKKEVWQTALNLWETKGIAFVKTINMGEDGVKTGAAITPLAIQQGTALAPLLNSWAHYANQIRESTGINPATDGTMAPDALVGISQLAQLASNTVTRGYVKASVLFKKRLCEVISTRLHAIFRYKEAVKLRELYTNVVGKEMLDAIEVLKDRHLHEFAFTYEVYPTVDDINELKEDLAIALQAGQIDVAVKYETIMIARSNIKRAAEYLKYEIRKSIKEAHERELAAAEHKSRNDAMAAQSKVQADTQSYSVKKQIDLDFAIKMAEIDVQKEQALTRVRQPETEREFEHEEYMTKIKAAGDWNTKKYLEDRKDDRTGIQATQQSKLKKQAMTNGQPIDFANENSWFEPNV